MLSMEEILCELERYDMKEQGLPPGFRFYPTDEELITFYLVSKVFNGTFCGVNIAEVDLNRCEPWELPDVAKMGEREWYFFSLRDRKYPTGLRTNRATGAGYWKATGKDREVYSNGGAVVGMKKTLVFYRGRAPRGEKTKWVMHEYRLDGDLSCRHACKEEWVICRIYHKLVEKKNPALLYQNYCINKPTLSGSSSSPLTTGSYSLPPLLESSSSQDPLQNTLQNQNPFLGNHRQEISDLKSLINPNHFPLSISPNAAIGAINQLDSLLFSHDQTRINPSEYMRWGSEQILEGYQNPLGIGGIFGVPLAANYSNGMEDFKFNREGLEMMIDHPVGDSCPMDH